MLDLVNAAKKIGFDAFGASGEYEDLIKEHLPCIAHVIIDNQPQHFIVIYESNLKRLLFHGVEHV